MKKTDPTVKKETFYILVWTILLSVLMNSVFLIIKRWDVSVLYGNIVGAAVAVLNFFLLGRTVQNALEKEEKDAKNTMKLSQMLRYLMMIIVIALAVAVKVFNIIAVVVPLIFPRIAIAMRPFFNKQNDGKGN